MEYRTINHTSQLLRELGIDSLETIRRSEHLKRQVALRLPYLSPELIKELLVAIPELSKAFQSFIATFAEIGWNLETTKRMRWETLQKIAATGIMTGEQILEAMRIIAMREEKEWVDWNQKMDQMKDAQNKTRKTTAKIALSTIVTLGALGFLVLRAAK